MLKYYLALCLLFFGLTVPLVFKDDIRTFDYHDEVNHHYPAILTFVDTFPNLDLLNYRSATTPLFHLIMMAVVLVTNLSLHGLRLVSSLFSLACVLVVFRYLLAKTADANKAFFLALLFMLSTYFVGAAIRLETDNLALLFVILTLVALDVRPLTIGRLLGAAVLASLAVLTRQIHLWLAGVGGFVALFQWDALLPRRIAGAATMLLPGLALLPLLLLWRGLSPANYNEAYQASFINIDNFAFGLSVFGTLAAAFLPWYWRMYRENRPNPLIFVGVVAAALVYLLLFPPGASGRLDGYLWKLAEWLPGMFGVSLFFWIAFPLGVALFALVVIDSLRRKNLLLPVSAALWLASNLASAIGFQKYYEPFWVFFIALTIVPITITDRRAWVLPLLLMGVFIALDITRFHLALV